MADTYVRCTCGHAYRSHRIYGASCRFCSCGCWAPSIERLDVLVTDVVSSLTGEVRTTDPDTGAQKGMKPERFDLIPIGPLTELARHYGVGALKYADRNWEKGYDWSKSYAALQRHLTAFWGGEDLDPETGSKHIIAAMWHAAALAQFMDQHPEKDDRPTTKEAS